MPEELAEIEVLTLRHLPQLTAIMEEVYRQAATPIGGIWTREILKQELDLGQGLGLSVEGFGLAAFLIYRLHEQHREITVLATHPARHRKGDMHFLLTSMLDKRLPGERIWLEVHDANQSALALYGAVGFAQVGRREKYYRDGGDALLLTLL